MNKLAVFVLLFAIALQQTSAIFWPRQRRDVQDIQNLVPVEEMPPSRNLRIIAPPERKYGSYSLDVGNAEMTAEDAADPELTEQISILEQFLADKAVEIQKLWAETQVDLAEFSKKFEQLIEEEVANKILLDQEAAQAPKRMMMEYRPRQTRMVKKN
ncbi:uncharacterized protein LOC114333576 [Diabrotica virgifera virgifera]|uniref:Uncharacterized protein LOC114333576 n=1 Tax=Diabrotica virgifera virgifera TaxID=50390 RepID=A0A6P7FSJ8_DIAVI|nr:uncharacterized protein LOC114333576 [Diabrotica virgifera virgifera]